MYCKVLYAVVSAFEYFFLLTVPPILHLTQCIIFAIIYSIGMPNQTMLQLSSEGFKSGSISEQLKSTSKYKVR